MSEGYPKIVNTAPSASGAEVPLAIDWTHNPGETMTPDGERLVAESTTSAFIALACGLGPDDFTLEEKKRFRAAIQAAPRYGVDYMTY